MSKKRKHINIPVFIPHLGCPNDCVFCNQRSISGKLKFDLNSVKREIEEALSTVPSDAETEIAFFGGSFTGIDRDLMIYLLKLAQRYVDDGRVRSIRLSTRPDYINDEIIDILKSYSVRTIELGIQSMSDNVLDACKRGHKAEVSAKACKMIKEAGFSLIGQMMIGLPGADIDDEIKTAEAIVQMGADGTRVYPTVVFYETELCQMAANGKYSPLTNDQAIHRTKEVLKVFNKANVPCIRVGLCASENLSSEDSVYGGANHSAIGELAIGEIFYEQMDELISKSIAEHKIENTLCIGVPMGCTSKAVGQRRKNILRLCDKYSLSNIKIVEKNSIIGYNITIE